MSDSADEFEAGTYPPVQYAFFTAEGGQWVFRGDTVADVQTLLTELLDAVDESEGPGILTDLQALKAAGVLKEGKNPAQNNSGGGSSGGDSSLPSWVLTEAAKVMGREVSADEVKSGQYKNKAGTWYKVGDNWINQPRGRG